MLRMDLRRRNVRNVPAGDLRVSRWPWRCGPQSSPAQAAQPGPCAMPCSRPSVRPPCRSGRTRAGRRRRLPRLPRRQASFQFSLPMTTPFRQRSLRPPQTADPWRPRLRSATTTARGLAGRRTRRSPDRRSMTTVAGEVPTTRETRKGRASPEVLASPEGRADRDQAADPTADQLRCSEAQIAACVRPLTSMRWKILVR